MTSAREWNARAYHVVSRPQVSWGEAVLQRLPLRGDEDVIDAGCGTGLLTSDVLARLSTGRVIAMDRSFNMLEVAREHLPADRVTFVQADVLAMPFREAADAIFSTATFHWVLDHPRLFRELHATLRPGGWLVAQCGGEGNLARLHGRAEALMTSAAFRDDFRVWSEPWEFASAEVTAARLAAAGFVDIETTLETRPTPFADADEIKTFLVNVVLRPFLQRIADPRRAEAFVAELIAQLASDDPPFVLDYVRLNLRARRP